MPELTNVEKARARIKRAIADLDKAPDTRTKVTAQIKELRKVLAELPAR